MLGLGLNWLRERMVGEMASCGDAAGGSRVPGWCHPDGPRTALGRNRPGGRVWGGCRLPALSNQQQEKFASSQEVTLDPRV